MEKLTKKKLGNLKTLQEYFVGVPSGEIDQSNPRIGGPGMGGCFICHVHKFFSGNTQGHHRFGEGASVYSKLFGGVEPNILGLGRSEYGYKKLLSPLTRLLIEKIYNKGDFFEEMKRGDSWPFNGISWPKHPKDILKEIIEEQESLRRKKPKAKEPKKLPPNVIQFKKKAG